MGISSLYNHQILTSVTSIDKFVISLYKCINSLCPLYTNILTNHFLSIQTFGHFCSVHKLFSNQFLFIPLCEWILHVTYTEYKQQLFSSVHTIEEEQRRQHKYGNLESRAMKMASSILTPISTPRATWTGNTI
jgi:hypothetical protein